MEKKFIAIMLISIFAMQPIFESNILAVRSRLKDPMPSTDTSTTSGQKGTTVTKDEPSTGQTVTPESGLSTKDIIAISGVGLIVLVGIVGKAKGWWSASQAAIAVTSAVSGDIAGATAILAASAEANGRSDVAAGINRAVGTARVLRLSAADSSELEILLKRIPGFDISGRNISLFINELLRSGDLDSALKRANITTSDADTIKQIKSILDRNKTAWELSQNPEALKDFVEKSRAKIKSKIDAINDISDHYKIDKTKLSALEKEFSAIQKETADTVDLRKLMDLTDNINTYHKTVLDSAAKQKIAEVRDVINQIKTKFGASNPTTMKNFNDKLASFEKALKDGKDINITDLNKLSEQVVQFHNSEVADVLSHVHVTPGPEHGITPLPTPHSIPVEPVRIPVEPIRPHEPVVRPPAA